VAAASRSIIDPDEPSVLALEFRDGRYVEAGRVVGDETLALELPFPVRLCPQALLG